MKKMLLLCGALLLVSASVAAAGGVLNNAWDACVGDGGTLLRTSACTANTNTPANSNVAVQSVILSADMLKYQGNVCFINVSTEGAVLPAWWSCAGKLSPFSAVGGASTCTNDAYAASGGGGGGLAATTVGFNGPNTVQGIYSEANAAGTETDLFGATEYFLGSITISNLKSGGTGNCAGCLLGACINFAQCNMDHLVNGTSTQDIIRAGGAQPYIRWQNALASCQGATAARKTTWGGVKALYR